MASVFSFDEPDDQIDTLNKLINDCIEHHAPLKHSRISRPIAPWMKDPEISQARLELEQQRLAAKDTNEFEVRLNYQRKKNQYKRTIKEKRTSFFEKHYRQKTQKLYGIQLIAFLQNSKNE